MTDSAHLDKVAEAMWHDQNGDPFSTAESRERGHYLRMAQAAIEALQLTEERGVQEVDIPSRIYKSDAYVAAVVARPVPELRVVSRLVSGWVRVDGGDA